MFYVGIDVHASTSTYCVLDEAGEIVTKGRCPTTAHGFREVFAALGDPEQIVAGQEVGSFAYFVRDTLTDLGVEIRSFNAKQLRVIAASRKKSDRRDAFWIARLLQTGLTPHPVYIPTGRIRELRGLLTQREFVKRDRTRWVNRARGALKTLGIRPKMGRRRLLEYLASMPDELPEQITRTLELCSRLIQTLTDELKACNALLRSATKGIPEIALLQTIPGIGPWSAAVIYAWVGEIERFPSAKHLLSYGGVVPSVRQSADANHTGHITKQGAPALRAALVQCAHSVATSSSKEAAPLRDFTDRVRRARGRYKISIVALARVLLRIAYYVLRDRRPYDASRIAA